MVEAADNATDSRVESLNIGRKRVEERCNAPGPLFTERVLLSMGPLKGTRMKGRVRRWRMCMWVCICVLCVYIRSWRFLPVELFTCPSPAPPELCARACFFYRPPISVSVTHFTSTPRPEANTVGGDVKKTHIRAFDINTRRLENIHSLIECFTVKWRQLDRRRLLSPFLWISFVDKRKL